MLKSRRSRAVTCVGAAVAYFAAFFVFAVCYQRLWQGDRFAFQIFETSKESYFGLHDAGLRNLSNPALVEAVRYTEAARQTFHRLRDDELKELRMEREHGVRGPVYELYKDRFASDLTGELDYDAVVAHIEAEKGLVNRVVDQHITVLAQQLIPLAYSDFLYFSVVTGATVGYGDMVPNSSACRRLVLLQVLTQLVLLSMVLPLMINLATGNLGMQANQGMEPTP
jgi:hypothetical protein